MTDDLSTITVVDGAVASWRCRHCGEPVAMVVDPISGVIDFGQDGDYGCAASPDTDDEATGSHAPYLDRPEHVRYWGRQAATTDDGENR